MTEAAQRRLTAVNRLVDWCMGKEKEFFIRADSVRAVVDADGAIHIVATQDIAAKSLILAVPLTLSFNIGSASRAELLGPEYSAIEAGIRAIEARRGADMDDNVRIAKGGLHTKDVDR
jgi:hypothetical protein